MFKLFKSKCNHGRLISYKLTFNKITAIVYKDNKGKYPNVSINNVRHSNYYEVKLYTKYNVISRYYPGRYDDWSHIHLCMNLEEVASIWNNKFAGIKTCDYNVELL